MRKILLAIVLTGCAVLGLPAIGNAAVNAAPHTTPMPVTGIAYDICFIYPTPWFCRPVPQLPGVLCPCPPPSCECFDAVDFGNLDTLPQAAQLYGELIIGIQDTGTAAVTTDPTQQAALRAGALNAFLGAAQQLDGLQVAPPSVGYVDANGVFHADPVNWRQQAGNDIRSGLTLLQQSLTSPNAQQLRSQAMAAVTEANAIFTQHGAPVQGAVNGG